MTNPHTPSSEAIVLLPCPFCGGQAEMWRAHPENPKRNAWIACMGRCAVLTKEYESNEAAIAAWNTRTAIQAMSTEQSEEVVRLRSALNAIIDRGPERDAKWAGMSAKDIAIRALTGDSTSGI